MYRTRSSTIPVVLTGLVVGCFVLFGVVVVGWQSGVLSSVSVTTPTVLGVTDTADPKPAPIPSTRGAITGIVVDQAAQSRPLTVCAEPTLGGPATCVTSASTGEYRLEVVPGQYTVYAFDPVTPTLRGTYTERSIGSLTSQQLIVLDVVAGQTISGVQPSDWTR